MSNIHTFRDIERGSASQPFPVPDNWRKSQQPQKHLMTDGTGGEKRYQMFYMGIDGERYAIQNPSPGTLCCVSCCPCFVPPLCDETKQQQYRNLVKTLCFWLSVIQFILLITSLGMGGFAAYSSNPSLGPPASTLIELGAKESTRMKDGQVWRFVLPIFLHGGIIHLAFNLFAQIRFGVMCEKKWGIATFIAIYLISGIGGVLMSCLLSPRSISVGASGALMGLMGAFLSEVIATWDKTDPATRKMNLIQAIAIIVITMIFSASKYIDASAHFGGVLCGFLLAMFLFGRSGEGNEILIRYRWISYLCIALLSLFYVLGFILFYTVVNV